MASHDAGLSRVVVRSDLPGQRVLREVFARRGWRSWRASAMAEDDWDVFWASVQSVRAMFRPASPVRLHEGQILNHFPNHYELSRKDLLVKNWNMCVRSEDDGGRRRRSRRRFATVAESTARSYRKDRLRRGETCPDILPKTYYLPQDYHFFAEEARRNPEVSWIVKPAGRSQGKGIFLMESLSQLRNLGRPSAATDAFSRSGRHASSASAAASGALPGSEHFIVSRYIDRPLLVGGRKFDLRLYVLVTSFRPLRAYMHHLGFARFCTVEYVFHGVSVPAGSDPSDEASWSKRSAGRGRRTGRGAGGRIGAGGRDGPASGRRGLVVAPSSAPSSSSSSLWPSAPGAASAGSSPSPPSMAPASSSSSGPASPSLSPSPLAMHLTNVAIQKHTDDYSDTHGGKWPLANLILHLEGVYGRAAARRVFADIQSLVVHSLRAVQPRMHAEPHCFELYGYDVILDEHLHPWLMEVNASPSLTATTDDDFEMKVDVVSDAFDTVLRDKGLVGVVDEADEDAPDRLEEEEDEEHEEDGKDGGRAAERNRGWTERRRRRTASGGGGGGGERGDEGDEEDAVSGAGDEDDDEGEDEDEDEDEDEEDDDDDGEGVGGERRGHSSRGRRGKSGDARRRLRVDRRAERPSPRAAPARSPVVRTPSPDFGYAFERTDCPWGGVGGFVLVLDEGTGSGLPLRV